MPATIKMSLLNRNPTPSQIASLTYSANLASIPKTMKTTPLNAGMIQRIHNARSGCGSCGRK